MPLARINGQVLHYQRVQRDPELVMIHGLMANLAFWFMGVLPFFSDIGMTAFDLRGHGLSSRPPTGYTTEEMARDLVGLLDHLGIERAHLVGHSFGGAVALHAAILFPKRIRSLILADARVPALQPPLQNPTQRQWDLLRRRLERLGIELPEGAPRVSYTLFRELAASVGGPRARAGREVPPGQALLRAGRQGGSAMTQWMNLVRTTTVSQDVQIIGSLTPTRMREVRQPTLAVFGQRSNCLPTLRGLQEHVPGCRTVLVPRAGHMHPLVHPALFVRHVRDFVNGVAA